MAFSRLNKYSDGAFPQAGTATDYTLCENISSYLPFDIGDAKGAINSELDKINSLKSETTSKINSSISKLDEEWGKKFISINDNGLDFVQPTEMKKSVFSEIDSDSNGEIEKCKNVVESVESGLSEVKEYVKKLQQNLEKYKKLVEDLNNAKSRANNISTQINSLKNSKNPNNTSINSLENDLSDIYANIQTLSTQINSLKNSENPDNTSINSLENDLSDIYANIHTLSIEIDLYESSKIPEPDGQWIVK